MPELDPTKRWLTCTVATPLMTLTPDLGLSKHVSYVRVRETGACDWNLVGPLEWARAETGRADRGLK